MVKYSIKSKGTYSTSSGVEITSSIDSIALIYFDNKKLLKHSHFSLESMDCETRNNLYCLASFKVNKIDRHFTKYIYSFTEEDYQNATPIVPE